MFLTVTVVGLAFTAGGAWAILLRNSAKNAHDFKGISGKIDRAAAESQREINAIRDRNDRRYLTLCIVLVQFVPKENQAQAAALLDAGSK